MVTPAGGQMYTKPESVWSAKPLKPVTSEAVFDAGHVVLREESFGTRNEFGPSVLSRHHFTEVVRCEIPASTGSHDLETRTKERLD